MPFPQTVMQVVEAGGNVSLDASEMFPQTLIEIVALATRLGRNVTLRGCEKLFPNTMIDIAGAGRGNVTFEF